MCDVLLRDSVQSWHAEHLEAESGRHGVITDVTHDFFKQEILLTSLVFSQVLLRWVVILYTWIGGQDQDHHLPHFKQLVHVIAEICMKGTGLTFDDHLFSTIPHFSNAQRNGFIEAFIGYMCSQIPEYKEPGFGMGRSSSMGPSTFNWVQALESECPGIAPVEQHKHVLSVGFALPQLLAIQHELKEELNLNGDTLLDLLDGSIVPCKIERSKALAAIFLAIEPLELKHRKGWDLN
ncbi:hypothetical protein DFH08DRAFT_809053 [Mycena albidolilacea]|uniref:Uncharacterized protein n=1 Tax=Mycena albidolilacea TaxID=1033008 RepID=A0AAD7A224_9AGAR|nr:hypothetical protein DFH08DRAFT_809053 [Mycena albidolilacea]